MLVNEDDRDVNTNLFEIERTHYINNDPTIEPDSNWNIIKNITGLSIPMALSYTFSLQMILLVYLLSNIDEEERIQIHHFNFQR